MSVSYPGVYLEEGQPPRRIDGVPTSVAAFIGRAPQGPRDSEPQASPTPIASWAEYERVFGGLAADSTLGYAVQHFFANGGATALVVRAGGDAPLTDDDIAGPGLQAAGRGIWALDRARDVNLLSIPPLGRGPGGDIAARTRQAALSYCRARRAVFLVDPLARWQSSADVLGGEGVRSAAFGLEPDSHAAVYFPYLRAADPLQGGAPALFAPGGAVAGLIARTDATRGVWKAPAGSDADLRGIAAPAIILRDAEQGLLNPQAVNCIRQIQGRGNVVWGARSWAGQDRLGSEFRYLNVRRLASYLESAITRGTQWAVFEPKGEPLWAALRASIGAFLQELFRAGAFQGTRASDAYYVRCDATTHSPADLAQGRVNVMIGFAPLRPAEFIVIHIAHMQS